MALFDSLLAWLVSVVGVATGAAYVPQALRIWKRRSSDDVSILTYLLFLGGQIVYLVYGIRIRQWPLIIGMGANIVGSVAVILLLADKTRAQAVSGLVLVLLGLPVYLLTRRTATSAA